LTKLTDELQKFVNTLTARPGVYRMLDRDGQVIYVGKAGNLRKRVASYFARRADSPKTLALVSHVAAIEVTVTRTEGEALLLESDLIKALRPRYNVVFKDDKSYPYLYLSLDDDFPRLSFHRGPRRGKGRYFGPFPGAGAARMTLNLVQKLFRIRQCDESFFRNRSRPCLQAQINRCTAPCVGWIDAGRYAEDVRHASLFLDGRNEEVIRGLTGPMQEAAAALEFERAARLRDRIAALRRIQEQQQVVGADGECDVIACAELDGSTCIQVFSFRGGRNLGNRGFFPGYRPEVPRADVVSAFVTQQYLGREEPADIPPAIYVSHLPVDRDLLQRLLTGRCGRQVSLLQPRRGSKRHWVDMALENARLAISQRNRTRDRHGKRLEALQLALDLPEMPARIECFDVSHTMGESAVASCVVFGTEGALKSDYRRFNLAGIAPGDDYAGMRQVIERRYARLKSEDGLLPDLVLVDGGKGQVGASTAALRELQLEHLPVVGVAKGPSRKPGLETLILNDGRSERRLAADSPALHLIQAIRDEAHRFAVTGHRQRRQRTRGHSPLEDIAGVGSKRRRTLLQFFGGLQGVQRAGIAELAKVPGINKNLAARIYATLHDD